ncbi:hypothetical protein [Flavobacterium sp. FPG59]|jgi:uncharacterized protein YcfL|uniref:hypothetical protein n=1 Tax=Flavobacterium sp. FPG59 TaxID=1929267 RepID=UPI000A392177|nr:hypothetical protein [Flavobacterium sp. FPG59]OUD34491.1 hypothetical protein FPG59_13380 [Flavobacterium sp. FPG59]
MKKLILLTAILLVVIGCKTTKDITMNPKIATNTIKIAVGEISDIQKNKAYELGKRVLMTCNTSKFKPFTADEATPSVIQNTTQERLTKTCQRFRQYYGTFEDLKLIEAYTIKSDNSIIFRYKALYSKNIANKELRVTMTSTNKVSSIKSLDWKDEISIN